MIKAKAKEKIRMGAAVVLTKGGKKVKPASPDGYRNRIAGLALHDIQEGDSIEFCLTANTKDIAVSGIVQADIGEIIRAQSDVYLRH